MQIRVHIPSQTLDLLDGSGALVRRYAISTSKHGAGFEEGSQKTPYGEFGVCEKIGAGAEPGAVFIGRKPAPLSAQFGDLEDRVQTRILWLDGIEPRNANTRNRYIYIHGTNAESQLGVPSSHGCIRMSNDDVIDLFDRVETGARVIIDAGDDPMFTHAPGAGA